MAKNSVTSYEEVQEECVLTPRPVHPAVYCTGLNGFVEDGLLPATAGVVPLVEAGAVVVVGERLWMIWSACTVVVGDGIGSSPMRLHPHSLTLLSPPAALVYDLGVAEVERREPSEAAHRP
jgi:hypothetical protein